MKYLSVCFGFLLMISIVSGASVTFSQPTTSTVSGSIVINGGYSGFAGNVSSAQLNIINLTYNGSIPIIYANGFWAAISSFDTPLITNGNYNLRVQINSDQGESTNAQIGIIINNAVASTTAQDYIQAIKDLTITNFTIDDDALLYSRQSPYANEKAYFTTKIYNKNRTQSYIIYYEIEVEDGETIQSDYYNISSRNTKTIKDSMYASQFLDDDESDDYPDGVPFEKNIILNVYLGTSADTNFQIFSTDTSAQQDIRDIEDNTKQEDLPSIPVTISNTYTSSSTTSSTTGLTDIFGDESKRIISITKTEYGTDSVTLDFKSGIYANDIKSIGVSPSGGRSVSNTDLDYEHCDPSDSSDTNCLVIWTITFTDDGDYRVYVLGSSQYRTYSKSNTMNITISGIVDEDPKAKGSYYSATSTTTSPSSEAEALAAALKAKGLTVTPTPTANNSSEYATKSDIVDIIDSAIAARLQTPVPTPKASKTAGGDGGWGIWISIIVIIALIIVGAVILWKSKSWIRKKLNRHSDNRASQSNKQPALFDGGESAIESQPSKKVLREFGRL